MRIIVNKELATEKNLTVGQVLQFIATKLAGKTEITDINIDVIPASQRHNHFKGEGDLVITEEMKTVLIESVNYALANPFTIPAK